MESITAIKSEIIMKNVLRAELVLRYLALNQPSNSSMVIPLRRYTKTRKVTR
jgi:hypothetical protein